MRKVMLAGMLALSLLSTGCLEFLLSPGIRGSGVEASDERQVSPFTGIDLKGSPDIMVTIGEPLSVEVTADDNLLEVIETRVADDTLFIGSKESYSSRIGVKIKIVVPSLEKVVITGSGDISVTGLNGGLFEARVSGSGDIDAGGAVDSVEAVVTGSGTVDLDGLEAHRGVARVTGSGDIYLNVDESLDATVTGSGDIRYRGGAEDVDTSVTGSGDIIGS